MMLNSPAKAVQVLRNKTLKLMYYLFSFLLFKQKHNHNVIKKCTYIYIYILRKKKEKEGSRVKGRGNQTRDF